jgi:hypothetical protein
VEVPLPPPTPIVKPVPVAPVPEPVIPPPPVEVPVPPPQEPQVQEVVAKPVYVEPIIIEATRPKPAVAVRAVSAESKRNYQSFFYLGIAATAIVAVVIGGGLVTWLMGDSATPNGSVSSNPTNINVVTPIREDGVAKAVLPPNRADWYANVIDSGKGGTLTVTPIISIGGAEKVATTPEVLATLDWEVESALIRSISDITFIMAEQKPAIVLKVTAFDAAFGGFLLSERELSTELFPLFGPVVTSTYMVGVGTTPPQFVDELAANHDVRVLKDEMENERLVYGFIDQGTVVIAPDKETFLLIAERLR